MVSSQNSLQLLQPNPLSYGLTMDLKQFVRRMKSSQVIVADLSSEHKQARDRITFHIEEDFNEIHELGGCGFDGRRERAVR
jgi:hypothetical protein